METKPKRHRRSEAQIRASVEASCAELARISKGRSREWWVFQCKNGAVRWRWSGEGKVKTRLVLMSSAVALIERGYLATPRAGRSYTLEDVAAMKETPAARRAGRN